MHMKLLVEQGLSHETAFDKKACKNSVDFEYAENIWSLNIVECELHHIPIDIRASALSWQIKKDVQCAAAANLRNTISHHCFRLCVFICAV